MEKTNPNPPQDRVEELPSTLLDDLTSIANDIFSRWDRDQRSGKLLMALLGELHNYDPRVTRIRAALRQSD